MAILVEINGKKILPADVTGEKRPVGKNIGISGDTRPTDKLVTKFFENCDYLSFDCTFSDDMKGASSMRTNHSTAKEAAELAKTMLRLEN